MVIHSSSFVLEEFFALTFWLFEALLLPTTDRNILDFFLKIFPQISKKDFLSLFFEYERSPPPLYKKELHTPVSHKRRS